MPETNSTVSPFAKRSSSPFAKGSRFDDETQSYVIDDEDAIEAPETKADALSEAEGTATQDEPENSPEASEGLDNPVRVNGFDFQGELFKPKHKRLWSMPRVQLQLGFVAAFISRSVTTINKKNSPEVIKPCYRTYEQIARHFGVNKKTIERAIEKLVELGWIEKVLIAENKNGVPQNVFYTTIPAGHLAQQDV